MSAAALSQGQLYEPPKRRRLSVPPGHRSWWGIDPSSKRIALAVVLRAADGSLDRRVRSAPFMPGEGGLWLSEMRSVTIELAAGAARAFPPGVVLVEQASGKFVEHALEYAIGTILAAVHDAVYAVTGQRIAVETIPSSSWKLQACGNGGIGKPTKKKLGRKPVFEDYAVARWAVLNGYGGVSWDEADAMGIAEAARREVELVER